MRCDSSFIGRITQDCRIVAKQSHGFLYQLSHDAHIAYLTVLLLWYLEFKILLYLLTYKDRFHDNYRQETSNTNKLNYGCAPKRAYIQSLYLRLIAKACILGLCQRLIFKTYILGLYSNAKCLFPSDISGAEPQVRLYVRTSAFNLGRVQMSYFCTKHLTN